MHDDSYIQCTRANLEGGQFNTDSGNTVFLYLAIMALLHRIPALFQSPFSPTRLLAVWGLWVGEIHTATVCLVFFYCEDAPWAVELIHFTWKAMLLSLLVLNAGNAGLLFTNHNRPDYKIGDNLLKRKPWRANVARKTDHFLSGLSEKDNSHVLTTVYNFSTEWPLKLTAARTPKTRHQII